jgi:hypothetical protein
MVNRWKRAALGLLAGLSCAALAGCSGGPPAGAGRAHPTGTRSAGVSGGAGHGPAIGYPQRGAGRFDVASTGGPVLGTAGLLLTYRVMVERGIRGITSNDFARQVSDVLGDPRSWIGTGLWRLQQVPPGVQYDFTVYLATPTTRAVLCADPHDLYTSCRNGNRVVLNVARWVHGVPDYGASLTVYHQYMINHETGHRLLYGHERCPGPGALAPVMQQQTLGLHGCVANAWPVPDGQPYHGRSGEYDDPIPVDTSESKP